MTLQHNDRRAAQLIASLLLSYPDEAWRSKLPSLREMTERLPAQAAMPLLRFIDVAMTKPAVELAADYSATFDFNRRCSLYLSYYRCGDTRKRGAALLKFSQAYRSAGLAPPDAELPDHLAVVLEFSALTNSDVAAELLQTHRAEIALLGRALREAPSPYAYVLQAVEATLPSTSKADRDTVMRLLIDGPPQEEVGLEPFGTAEPAGARR